MTPISVDIYCPVPGSEAGLSLCSTRWHQSLRAIGIESALHLSMATWADEVDARRGVSFDEIVQDAALDPWRRVLVVGLPAHAPEAERIVALCARLGSRAAILWERPLCTYVEVGANLSADWEAGFRLLTFDEAVLPHLQTLTSADNLRVVRPALPHANFSAAGTSGDYALAIGRNVASKRILELAEAWDALASKALPKLLVMTSSDGTERYARLVTLVRNSARLRLADGRSLVQRAAALEGARFCVFPALSDHMPQVLLETMAASVPVIATPIAAHRVLIEHGVTGLLFSSTDIATGLSELESILQDAQLPAVARRALDRVQSTHSQPVVANILVEAVA